MALEFTMRIIAGKWRSRALTAPAGEWTRPTSDRLRETLFNVLAPRIEGAAVLDFYAGSGAVALEALSRGARLAVAVERAPAPLAAMRKNAVALAAGSGFQPVSSSVAAFLKKPQKEKFDIVFLDPPYDLGDEYELALGLLGGSALSLLADEALIIAEHRKKDRLAERYGELKRMRLLEQGDAGLSFFQRAVQKEPESATATGGEPQINTD